MVLTSEMFIMIQYFHLYYFHKLNGKGVVHMSILQKIWNYKFHYFIVLPALLYLVLFKVIPMFQIINISMVDYQPFKGLAGSTWVGFDNFRQVLAAFEFSNVLSNTLTLRLAYIFLASVIALILALALANIRSAKVQGVLTTLVMIPYFIPTVVIIYIAFLMFSTQSPFFTWEQPVLGKPGSFFLIFLAIEIVTTIGIPVLIALAAIQAYRAKHDEYIQRTPVWPALKAIMAFMLLQLSTLLTVDFELMYGLFNPLVYSIADNLQTYTVRIGLMQAKYSYAAAIWVIQYSIQLILTLLVYVLIRRFFVDALSHPLPAHDRTKSKQGLGWFGLIISAIYAAFVVVLLYVLFVYPWLTPSSAPVTAGNLIGSNAVNYLMIALGSTIIFMLITATLAYPLTVSDLPGRSIYKLLLIIMLVAGNSNILEYLHFRNMGYVNTIWPQLILGSFSLISVFILKSIFNSKYANLKQQAAESGQGELITFFVLFIPKMWRPLLALGVLQFISIWNGYSIGLIYIADSSLYPPTLQFWNMMQQSGANESLSFMDSVFLRAGALLSIPGVVLFLLFRKWITSEVLLSQIRKL